MLTEERKRHILELLEIKDCISVSELMDALDASESTIRRDLSDMDSKGLLKKVHGGAVSLNRKVVTIDQSVTEREDQNIEQKQQIAAFAASLVKENDVVFLDAGTTTGMIIPYLKNIHATFITNAVTHARLLSNQGHQVYVTGGMMKSDTEALIGAETVEYLANMNFTIGFFGTNGVSLDEGFTTPDVQEGAVKRIAFAHAKERYILADVTKFDKICSTTFGKYNAAIIITHSSIPKKYKTHNCVLVDLI